MATLLDKRDLSLAVAQSIAEAAMHEALSRKTPVTIAVVDQAGHLLLLQRMDGVHIGTIEVAIAKARSAAMFRRPTAGFAEGLAAGGIGLLALPNVMPFPGGMPLLVDDLPVGAIGISGAAPDVDQAIADAAAALVSLQ